MSICIVCHTHPALIWVGMEKLKIASCVLCIPRYVELIKMGDEDCEKLLRIWRDDDTLCHICHEYMVAPAARWMWTRGGDMAVCGSIYHTHGIYTAHKRGCSRCGCALALYEMLSVSSERLCIKCINSLIPNYPYKGHAGGCARCGCRTESTWSHNAQLWQCDICALAHMKLTDSF
jgi:hypothetical protein